MAIEFAMLALPFCALTFAILESCISFAAQEVLANATDDVGRRLRTGQITKADIKSNQTLIRDEICRDLEIMVAAGCPGLEVDLRSYTSFAEAASTSFDIVEKQIVLTKNGKPDPTGFAMEPGTSLSKNMLRVFYRWPIMTDLMRYKMATLDDGKTLHFASVTWQNEPFDD